MEKREGCAVQVLAARWLHPTPISDPALNREAASSLAEAGAAQRQPLEHGFLSPAGPEGEVCPKAVFLYSFLTITFFLTEEIHIHFRNYRINKTLRANHCRFFRLPKHYSLCI